MAAERISTAHPSADITANILRRRTSRSKFNMSFPFSSCTPVASGGGRSQLNRRLDTRATATANALRDAIRMELLAEGNMRNNSLERISTYEYEYVGRNVNAILVPAETSRISASRLSEATAVLFEYWRSSHQGA